MMFKKIWTLCLVAAPLVIAGCGDGEIAPTTEEAPMDEEQMNKMAGESMTKGMENMSPDQQEMMKKQMDSMKK